MSIKLKALLQLIAMITGGVAGGAVLTYTINTLSPETIRFVLGAGLIGAMLYFCYSILLARLEYEAKVNELANKSVDK